MENIKILKRYLKNKVRLNKALMITFLLTGALTLAEGNSNDLADDNNTNIININIISNEEKKGLELGDKGYARGEGSITTGNSNIAIGEDAVATGGNESKETVLNKLKENENRINEIKTQEEIVKNESKELENLRLKYRETIEAANRVNALRISKKNAYSEYERLKASRIQLEADSQDKLTEYNRKIEDLNTRLSALSTIPNLNLNSENGLTEAATKLKEKVEEGTTLDLSLDFYKEYAKNYYKSLGDLRENNIKYNKMSNNEYSTFKSNNQEDIKGGYLNLGVLDNYYNGIRYISYGLDFGGEELKYNAFNVAEQEGLILENKPTKSLKMVHNIETVALSKEKYDEYVEEIPKYKDSFNKWVDFINDDFLNQEAKDTMKKMFDEKMSILQKNVDIVYYQWKYEETRDTTWLDLKKQSIKEYNELKEVWSKNYKNKNLIKLPDSYKYDNIKQWKKENIDDIVERNKITVDKLTSELENELGINKEEIADIERTINNAKQEETKALNNYNNIQISAKDLLLAGEFEEVNRKILAKEKILLTATERLETLKRELTLNDFRDGENAIAIGRKTLASGNNSIAFGKGSITTSESGISIGNTNLTTGESSIAIGHGNNNFSVNGVALGQQNSVSGEKSIAIGFGNKIVGISSSVIGDPNIVYGDNNFIYGNNNRVGTENSHKNNNYILGSNIDATLVENSITLGNNSKAVNDSVSVGSDSEKRKIVNVKEGAINDKSNEVIVGKQLYDFANGTSELINKDKWKEILEVNSNSSNNNIENLDSSYIKLDGSNLNNNNRNGLINKLSEGANLNNTSGALITDEFLKNTLNEKLDKNIFEIEKNKFDLNLNNKANKDGSNLSESDLYNWKEKLGLNNLDIGSNITERLSRMEKEYKAGVASAIATSSTLKNLGNKKHTISASLGYYSKEAAGAITYSTHYSNFGIVASASLNSKLEFGAGLGISYTFGEGEYNKKESKEIINVVEPIIVSDENDEKIKNLEEKVQELTSKLENIKNKAETIMKVYTISKFEKNKYELTNEQKELIDTYLSDFKDRNITVIGYADTDGSDKFNLNLGLERANFVKEYLELKGIKVEQIRSSGFNEIITNNKTNESKAINRRVEIIIR